MAVAGERHARRQHMPGQRLSRARRRIRKLRALKRVYGQDPRGTRDELCAEQRVALRAAGTRCPACPS